MELGCIVLKHRLFQYSVQIAVVVHQLRHSCIQTVKDMVSLAHRMISLSPARFGNGGLALFLCFISD